MGKPFILFDLDGTISDPIEGIWRSFNYALSHFGYAVLTRQQVSACIGPPLDETFRLLTGRDDLSHITDLVEKYRERFGQVGYAENKLYPGVKDAILLLVANQIPLGVCTSKRKDFADKILELFGLSEYFRFVSGGDVGVKKVQQIRSLLADNLIGRDAVMVGDRAVDLLAAHQNGIESAGVLWGYGSRAELESQSPRFLLNSPDELRLLMA